MKRCNWLGLSGFAVFLILALVIPAVATAGDHAYVGAEKCKMCHNSPAKGAQFTKWQESAHAKAYATLASEESKKIATEKGIGDPQKAAECLKCHVTGHGADAALLTEKYKVEDGVGCESCHGAGGDYMNMKVMKDHDASVAAGMVVPTEETCKTCHNPESPTYKEFDFASFNAKIAHPNPKKAEGK